MRNIFYWFHLNICKSNWTNEYLNPFKLNVCLCVFFDSVTKCWRKTLSLSLMRLFCTPLHRKHTCILNAKTVSLRFSIYAQMYNVKGEDMHAYLLVEFLYINIGNRLESVFAFKIHCKIFFTLFMCSCYLIVCKRVSDSQKG